MSRSAALRRGAAWLVALVLLCSCAGRAPAPRGPGPAPDGLEVQALERRPRLSLVERLGDPVAGVAFAAAHDLGPEASSTLATLLEYRLRGARLPNASVYADALGVRAQAHVSRTREVHGFLDAVRRAATTPVTPSEAALVESHFARRAPIEDHACAVDGPAPAWNRSAAALDRFRETAFSSATTSFAVVGGPAVLAAARQSLAQQPSWPPRTTLARDWPETDRLDVARSRAGSPPLSVTLRVPELARAMVAARALGADASVLSDRLRALGSGWSLSRSAAVAHVRGACLVVDLERRGSRVDASADNAATAAWVALDATRLAVARAAPAHYSPMQSILAPHDPADAATVAAWLALNASADGKPAARVTWRVAESTSRDAGRERLREAFSRASRSRAQIDVFTRVERGQAEVWALLGTPCGTALDPGDQAGASALLVHGLAAVGPEAGVRFEPWVTSDGVGLLAHAPKRHPTETPRAQAERVARALARRVASEPVGGRGFARGRSRLSTSFGTEPDPAWEQLLNALAPGGPSLLDARGTWTSSSQLGPDQVEALHRRFLRGPLRLAWVVNADPAQASAGTRVLERWLAPLRSGPASCPPGSVIEPVTGELALTTDAPPRAYVAVLLGEQVAKLVRELRATVLLLNRSGGWLEQALRSTDLASAATAQLIGGERLAALIVAVSAEADALPVAIAQVRALFQRLAVGAATRADARWADRALAELDRRAALDPRFRAVRTWKHDRRQALVFERLERAQRALGGAHVVVTRRPPAPGL